MTKNEKTAIAIAGIAGVAIYAMRASKPAAPTIPSVTSASQLTAEGNALLVGPKVDAVATASTTSQRIANAIKSLFGG